MFGGKFVRLLLEGIAEVEVTEFRSQNACSCRYTSGKISLYCFNSYSKLI